MTNKKDISEKLIKEFKDLISKNKGLEKIFHESAKFNLLGSVETKNSKII